jgi:endonuclease/exonuclease/phosphatase family metal-dependent hydrolase
MRNQRAALTLCIVLLLFPSLARAGSITVMSYNVENFFDDVHNGTEFREFDPSGGKWTTEFFTMRMDTIAEVVRKSVAGGPDILLLQEVENENALHALVDRGLAGMGYAWTAFVPKKGLSANVAIVSRIPMQSVHSWAVAPWKGTTPIRDIVEAEIQSEGHLLHVLDNHWKAKTEGSRQTEQSRRDSASVLAGRIRDLLAQDPFADIIAAGDFNENLDEYVQAGRKYQTALLPEGENPRTLQPLQSIFLAGNLRGLGISGDRCVLYDPWFEVDPSRRGSYYYQKDWLTFDHMLLSPGLFDARGFIYRWGSFAPVRLAFLLTPKGIPRKWTGLAGERSYSDHLPLLLTLDLKK